MVNIPQAGLANGANILSKQQETSGVGILYNMIVYVSFTILCLFGLVIFRNTLRHLTDDALHVLLWTLRRLAMGFASGFVGIVRVILFFFDGIGRSIEYLWPEPPKVVHEFAVAPVRPGFRRRRTQSDVSDLEIGEMQHEWDGLPRSFSLNNIHNAHHWPNSREARDHAKEQEWTFKNE